jgi:hypothetical protein
MTVRVTLGSACSQYLAGTALQANTTLVNKIHPKQCVPVVIDGLGIANEIRGPLMPVDRDAFSGPTPSATAGQRRDPWRPPRGWSSAPR